MRSSPGRCGVRPVLSEGADAHVDEPRVEVGRSDVPALHGAGPEVLDHDVGGAGEAAEQVLALGGRAGRR
jgi:hypothetical protein